MWTRRSATFNCARRVTIAKQGEQPVRPVPRPRRPLRDGRHETWTPPKEPVNASTMTACAAADRNRAIPDIGERPERLRGGMCHASLC